MNSLFRRKRNVVVMDGSNKEVLNEVIGLFGVVAYPNGGKFTHRPLDENHPNMIVIEAKLRKNEFENARQILEEIYPGLCIYDVAV